MLILASLVGVKLSKDLDYSKKINHYKKVAKDFAKFDDAWYLALYTDEEAWKEAHKVNIEMNKKKNKLRTRDKKRRYSINIY